MGDREQVSSIEPNKNVPMMGPILVLLNATTHSGGSVAIAPKAAEPVS